jgi:hypothetical protein
VAAADSSIGLSTAQNARADSDAVLLVDIGGGLGQDIVDFQKRYRHLPGRLVLQALPTVIESVQGFPTKVQAIGHDFFAPKPIQGKQKYSRPFKRIIRDDTILSTSLLSPLSAA